MAIQKRKAVAKSTSQAFKRSKAASTKKAKEEEEEEVQHEEDVEEENQEAEQAEVEAEAEESEEDQLKRREEEILAARKKELKAMPINDLKELATGKVEARKKEDIVGALAEHEAEARASQRAHQAKIREVVTKKKDELEALPAPELKDLCTAAGTKGVLAKPARVEMLLKHWQEDDGVDQAIAKMARDAREAELVVREKAALQKLCIKSGVECFVKEVIVERVVKSEGAQGRFARPKSEEDEDAEAVQPVSKSSKKADDMVDALLANEAKRKKEREQKKQEEDAATAKRKELKAMSMEELKKILTANRQETTGKKEDLVEAAFAISVQEDAAAAKKAKLKSMDLDKLKQRLASKGLQQTGKKEGLVDALLAHDAELREAARAWEVKVGDVLEKKKADLEEKTASELKDMCAAKSLKLGVGKQERVEVLLEDAQTIGEIDQIIAAMNKDARRDELLAMDKAAVLKIGEATGVDLLVKEVMVERILLHEDEFGMATAGEEEDKKRPAKKARTGKK